MIKRSGCVQIKANARQNPVLIHHQTRAPRPQFTAHSLHSAHSLHPSRSKYDYAPHESSHRLTSPSIKQFFVLHFHSSRFTSKRAKKNRGRVYGPKPEPEEEDEDKIVVDGEVYYAEGSKAWAEAEAAEAEEEEGPEVVDLEDLDPGIYIVGAPIGNMADLSFRAKDTLLRANAICCEDTRKTGQLLKAHQLRHDQELISYHKFTHPQKLESILTNFKKQNKAIAVVSEAGTPAISDPGSTMVELAHKLDIDVHVVPGPSGVNLCSSSSNWMAAVVSALSAAGFPADRFIFEGFLPKKSQRKKVLQNLKEQNRTIVFFESPHRIIDTMEDCIEVFGGDREAVVARELTKIHEDITRSTLSNLLEVVKQTPKGEFTIVIGPDTQKKKNKLKKIEAGDTKSQTIEQKEQNEQEEEEHEEEQPTKLLSKVSKPKYRLKIKVKRKRPSVTDTKSRDE